MTNMTLANMAAGMEEIKDLIKTAVQEALKEEKDKEAASATDQTSGYPVAKAKGKAKARSKMIFDETRRMTPVWGSDPRMEKEQWPCFGTHVETVGNNRFGKWTECSRCNLRMSYVPEINSPANSTKFDHGPNVVEALERLRVMGWKPEELKFNTVKNMIKVVASEKVTQRPTSEKSHSSKEKEKNRHSVEELHVDSDDSFEVTEMDGKKDVTEKKNKTGQT